MPGCAWWLRRRWCQHWEASAEHRPRRAAGKILQPVAARSRSLLSERLDRYGQPHPRTNRCCPETSPNFLTARPVDYWRQRSAAPWWPLPARAPRRRQSEHCGRRCPRPFGLVDRKT